MSPEGPPAGQPEPAPTLEHLRASNEEEAARRRVMAEIKTLAYRRIFSAFRTLWELSPDDRRMAVSSETAEIDFSEASGGDDLRHAVVGHILTEVSLLGPLADLFADSSVNEIMVNRFDEIFVERLGRLHRVARRFRDDDELERLMTALAASAGKTLTRKNARLDLSLPDGSRAHVILPPLSVRGPMLTVRKFSPAFTSISDLLQVGTVTPAAARLLQVATQTRQSVLVSGGTSSGKTTLLNVLSRFIPDEERVVVIEDTAELQMARKNIGRLVARHADGDGADEVSIRDLVRDALRMRPDRIIVGEVRGPEALDMLQAMNTGHEGSMTTIHANNPVAALARLQFLVTLADAAMPDHLVRAQIGTSINLIVQLARFADGARRIVSIVELTGMMGEIIQRQELFTFHHQGLDEGGQIRGELRPTAMVPKFFSDLREKGLDIQFDLFG